MTLTDLARLASTAFREPGEGAAWKQVNVELARVDGNALASARALFRSVLPVLDEWSRDGLLHGWFFMRKPPDVRLRVCLGAGAADAVAALDRALQACRDDGAIARLFWSEYSAEEERFGGAAAMNAVHAWFHIDSTLWCVLDALGQRDLRTTSADALLPALIDDLFRHGCGPGRAHEGWRELAALIREGGPFTFESDAASLPPSLEALASAAQIHEVERTALRSWASANAELVKRLEALRAASLTERSLREVVATAAFFSLNRHGFGGERSAPMTAGVLAALDAEGQNGT